ncbi:hypothetical protein [Tahibacter amnicola]|uniref:Alpha-L-rhamnosidase six-hairpin glycosidase domain-containing protein n=1 Tax=Tahibacter amnicola TaxID=2976241 RepID=A0ABY6BIJ6_9GAMM|nr:hypothetical protein [Tahibacter amnicola]UXI69178.1 hypothetical protein N4264_05890 [Tahibacter amnicola]
MALKWGLFALTALSGCHAWAAAPFVAPAVPSGSIQVMLCPTEVATPGSTRLVTFGLPLPRGSLTSTQLDTVRLLKGANEVAIFVDQLTPWRHRTNAALDGTSVRVARVQLNYSFAGTACEPVTVSWGGPPRTQTRPMLVTPRTGWHTVTTGTFVSADAVEEPDVYAVLPKEWLANGVLKGVRNVPFDASVPLTRENPATMDATQHWPGYTELDHAQKNNFFSMINEDDPAVTTLCEYKTDFDPWLYDRSSTMYALYFRSGSFKALREAVRASDFYLDHINASGYFTLKNGDAKYVYAENLAYTIWATGDTSLSPKLNAMLGALDNFNHVLPTDPGRMWTERHAAFKLLSNVIAYELNGGSAQRDKVNAIITQLERHQNGADGTIPQPAGYVDGAFYHLGSQHDNDWAAGSYGASSWMSVLLTDALLRAYLTAEDNTTAVILRRLGNFLRASVITTTAHSYDTYSGPLASPRYGVLSNGATGRVYADDVEHGLDVATGLAWSAYFADLTGQSALADQFRDTAEDLYFTYDTSVNHWVRPDGPASGVTAFRVSPWRKYGWEHRVSVGFAWAMGAGGASETIFANGFQ